MLNDLAKSVRSLLAQKRTLAEKEKALIENLNRVLPTMGYRVVPSGERGKAGQSSGAAKTYTCAQCGRRFGHWLHLGRHVSAMHRAKKAA